MDIEHFLEPCVPPCAQSKEECTIKLRELGQLQPGEAVYHIISPAAGGVHHPLNYCVLPDCFPSDYHMGEAKAKLHHILMLQLLSETAVKKALAKCYGEQQKATKLQELKDSQTAFEDAARSCNTIKRPRPASGPAQPDGGAPAQPDGGAPAQPNGAAPAQPNCAAPAQPNGGAQGQPAAAE